MAIAGVGGEAGAPTSLAGASEGGEGGAGGEGQIVETCPTKTFQLIQFPAGYSATGNKLLLSGNGCVVVGQAGHSPAGDDSVIDYAVLFRWTESTGVQIVSPHGDYFPIAISSDGATEIGFRQDSVGLRYAFRWRRETGYVESPAGDSPTCGSSDLSTIGGHDPNGGGFYESGGIISMIPGPSGSSSSVSLTPTAMTPDGGTVAGPLANDAFVWNASAGTRALGVTGFAAPQPIAISAGGQFVLLASELVDTSASPAIVSEFLNPTDSLPPGVSYSDDRGFSMDAMTPDASVLVGGIQTNDTVRFPELACVVSVSASPGYVTDTQTLLVQDLISSSDFDSTTIQLTEATDVSQDGKTLVGIMHTGAGATASAGLWVAKLDTEP